VTEDNRMDWATILFWMAGTLVAVLGPMILIHELGHFIMAKLAGVRVEEFGIGFPPRLTGLWRGKGSVAIGSTQVTIPRGFRVDPAIEVGTHVDAVAHRKQDGSLVLDKLEVADLDVTHDPRPAEADEVSVRGAVTELERGTLYSLNWLPVGAFVRMTGEDDPSDPRSLAAQPKRWRVAVLGAGALLNVAAAVLLLAAAYGSGSPQGWIVQVVEVEPASAAQEAGLLSDDLILAIDGNSVSGEGVGDGLQALHERIAVSAGQEIELTVLRGQESLTLQATPRPDEELGARLGIMMTAWPDPTAVNRHSFGEAVSAGFSDFVATIVASLELPGKVVSGEVSPEAARPASLIGISQILAFSLQQSIEWRLAFPVLQTAAFVSLGLGIANLLPLPALDGGRIAFVLLEAIRGRRILPEREAMIHFVGLLILLTVMAFVMFQDVFNPIWSWSVLK
jgi:regulator of sigma E protease